MPPAFGGGLMMWGFHSPGDCINKDPAVHIVDTSMLNKLLLETGEASIVGAFLEGSKACRFLRYLGTGISFSL